MLGCNGQMNKLLVLFCVACSYAQSQKVAKEHTKQVEPFESNPEKGYLIDAIICTDEPCARDYIKALNSDSGIEQRKMMADLQSLECIKKLPGVFGALGYEARNIRVGSGPTIRILRVRAVVNTDMTELITGEKVDIAHAVIAGSGWILYKELMKVSEKELRGIICASTSEHRGCKTDQ